MTLVFFDLETGGLEPQHPIIQVAAIAVDQARNQIDKFEAKIKFDLHLADTNALRLNSYDVQVWAQEAVSARQAMSSFSRFLRRHASIQMISRQGRPYSVAQLAAHNSMFDAPRLKNWYRTEGEFLPASPQVLCTLQRANWYFAEHPELPRPDNLKLVTLADYFDITVTATHDALADAQLALEVYRRM